MTGDGKDFFLEESRDLLATLETALLSLEKDPETKASIHDVFRSLHTIKGSGAMFGFDDASKFAHQVEYLFDDIRKGTIPISQEAIALGLRAKDCIQQLLESGMPQDETDAIVAEIRKIRGTIGMPPTENPLPSPQEKKDHYHSAESPLSVRDHDSSPGRHPLSWHKIRGGFLVGRKSRAIRVHRQRGSHPEHRRD